MRRNRKRIGWGSWDSSYLSISSSVTSRYMFKKCHRLKIDDCLSFKKAACKNLEKFQNIAQTYLLLWRSFSSTSKVLLRIELIIIEKIWMNHLFWWESTLRESVKIRSFFWSVFSCIRTESDNRKIWTRKKPRIWTLSTQCRNQH